MALLGTNILFQIYKKRKNQKHNFKKNKYLTIKYIKIM